MTTKRRRKPPRATHYALLDNGWRLVTLLQTGRKWVYYLETFEQPAPRKHRMSVEAWKRLQRQDVVYARGKARVEAKA